MPAGNDGSYMQNDKRQAIFSSSNESDEVF